VNYRGI